MVTALRGRTALIYQAWGGRMWSRLFYQVAVRIGRSANRLPCKHTKELCRVLLDNDFIPRFSALS